METITSTLRDAIKSQGRQTSAYVEVLVDTQDFAVADTASVTNGTESEYSAVDTILDGYRQKELIAHFQEDCYILDDNRYFPDDDSIKGVWFTQLEGGLGNMITIDFDEPTYVGQYMTFHWGQNEYPHLFEIQLDYTSPITVDGYFYADLSQMTVFLNRNDWDLALPTSQITIYINTWLDDKAPKLNAIDLGISRLYQDDKLISVKVREQTDHMSLTVPSNDVEVTIDNTDKEFDVLNPVGFYDSITIDAPINVWLGHRTINGFEYVEMGKFYLKEFEQDTGQMTFRGQDIISLLDNDLYYGWQGDYDIEPTAKDFIDGFMSIVGVTNYLVDADLDVYDGANTSFSWTDTRPLTIREMLSKICIRYGCNVWVDRQGMIRFDYFNDRDTFFFDGKLTTGNVVDLDTCEERNPKMTEVERMKIVNWFAERKFITAETQTIVPVREYTVDDGSDIILDMGQFVSSTLTVTGLTTTGTADVLMASGDGHSITVKTVGTGTVTFGLTDYIFVDDNYNNRAVSDTDMISLYSTTYGEDVSHIAVGQGYAIDLYLGNIYDSDVGIAPLGFYPDPLLWLFERNRKIEYRANWIGDISNNIGDIVKIENEFNAEKYMMITEQEFIYTGALKGFIKGVGN